MEFGWHIACSCARVPLTDIFDWQTVRTDRCIKTASTRGEKVVALLIGGVLICTFAVLTPLVYTLQGIPSEVFVYAGSQVVVGMTTINNINTYCCASLSFRAGVTKILERCFSSALCLVQYQSPNVKYLSGKFVWRFGKNSKRGWCHSCKTSDLHRVFYKKYFKYLYERIKYLYERTTTVQQR